MLLLASFFIIKLQQNQALGRLNKTISLCITRDFKKEKRERDREGGERVEMRKMLFHGFSMKLKYLFVLIYLKR